MAILFTQYWDVIPGRTDEYSSFITHTYIPSLQKMGIQLVGGYYVAVGEGPRIVAVATVDETENLRQDHFFPGVQDPFHPIAPVCLGVFQ